MTFLIKSADAEPMLLTGLAEVFQEMQGHYLVPCPSLEEILKGLKNRPEGAEIIVAMENSLVIGFAAYSAIYPGPYLQPGLFLKELYVRRSFRGRGVGRALLAYLAELALQRDLSRIDWTADANDERLLEFYDGLGGQRKPDKLFYRLDADGLKRLTS
ncbi:GNAT family N-acetyltransferase (plasmid) [Rhizobium sullae]|uniref:N-acetyltransferase n=1 Tax=Rhizobium sullae TaxID=50338 RepID=A0A2N0D1P3_RHISU|nr:GNAT family N-acetyltransferase [Rhizobium sullae]PKA40041.1 N-acetyltransferase [Rhizobium sullae]UWU18018.1 GNAT family N-acetyltransferase [Rhizobium sullae]